LARLTGTKQTRMLRRQPGTSTIILDAWQLLETALDCTQDAFQEWRFDIVDDSVAVVNAANRSKGLGKLLLGIVWPKGDDLAANGFVCLSHPTLETLPYFIPLVGMPTGIPGDRDWRFLCPIKRTLEQILVWDDTSRLFVSRTTVGRKRRQSDFRRAARAIIGIVALQHKWGALDEKPDHMRWEKYNALIAELEGLHTEWCMAASGVPELVLIDDTCWDVIAMSESGAKRAAQRIRKNHYLDKTGTLRMAPMLKKRLGML